MNQRFVGCAATLAAGALLAACGATTSGAMSAPLAPAAGEQDTFYVDCRDTFGVKNATPLSGSHKDNAYVASCSYQGRPLPWKVVEVYHAGLSDAGDWGRFRDGMIKRARKTGCRYIAIRTFPPTMAVTNEAVAGMCVQP